MRRWLKHGSDRGRFAAWSMLPAFVDPPTMENSFDTHTVHTIYRGPRYHRTASRAFPGQRGGKGSKLQMIIDLHVAERV